MVIHGHCEFQGGHGQLALSEVDDLHQKYLHDYESIQMGEY